MRCKVPLPPAAWGQEADRVLLQVDAKATLGLGGVVVVLGAVMAAMGLFSYLGVPSSLVVLQVVPFLVLAVGADNIFILVLEYQVSAHPRHACVGSRLCPCALMLLVAHPGMQGFALVFHVNTCAPRGHWDALHLPTHP